MYHALTSSGFDFGSYYDYLSSVPLLRGLKISLPMRQNLVLLNTNFSISADCYTDGNQNIHIQQGFASKSR